MIKAIRLIAAEDLSQLINLVWQCSVEIGTHTADGKIADTKYILIDSRIITHAS